jgi:iduronate 2-sulfatase
MLARSLSRRSLLALSLVVSGLAVLPAAAADAARPNVLFIAVDDLRPDLGCYGHPEAKTPHIDALAKRGMVFRRAYCQQAVCSPSRTSLLTGLRPDSTKVYDLETHFRTTIPDVVTLPQHFKDQGYHVVGMGKLYHGGLDDPKSWSEPHRNGPGKGYLLPENHERMATGRAKAKAAGKKGKALNRAGRGAAFEAADVPDADYHDGSLAELATSKLGELAKKDQPFFLAVGFLKPHLPFNAPKKYFDLYDPAKLDLAANPFRPKDAPPYAVTDLRRAAAVLRHSQRRAARRGARPPARARLSGGDQLHRRQHRPRPGRTRPPRPRREHDRRPLGRSRLEARRARQLVQTLEHGERHPQHAPRRGTGNQRRGLPCDRLVEFVDIYPTLCDLASLPLPAHLEGTSFKPLLEEPKKAWKSAALSQYPRAQQGQRLMGYALRTDRYRYVEWRNRQTGDVVATELYDHQVDPAENENVALRTANAGLVKRLSEQLAAGWRGAVPK